MDGSHPFYNCTIDTSVDSLSLKDGSNPHLVNSATDGVTGWAGQRLVDDVANASDLLQDQHIKLSQGTSYNILVDGRGCIDGQRGRWRGQGRREATGKKGYR
jgi:hypothetical protein